MIRQERSTQFDWASNLIEFKTRVHVLLPIDLMLSPDHAADRKTALEQYDSYSLGRCRFILQGSGKYVI